MRGIKSLIELFIHSDEEIESFGRWAFGKDYKSFIRMINYMNAWNTLHGDLLLLDVRGKPHKDMSKMVELWNNHKNIDN